MSYRDFSFSAFALPGLDVPIAEPGPDGKLYPTEAFRRWMEGVNFVRGGDGRDAIYDIDGDVADAVSDGVLTPAEKLSVIPLISAVQAAETDLVNAAAKVGVSSTAYEAAQDAFAALLATLTSPTAWNSSTGKTTIPDPADFKTKWQAVLDEEAALRAALDDDIANAVVDGTLTIAEKRIIVPQIKALQAEEASLVSAAANRNESSTAYEGKQDDLATYLATLTSPVAWDNFTGTTTIAAPGTFNTRVQDVIEARDALRSAIEAADIRNANLASRAATSTAYSASNSFGPYPMDRFSDTVFSDFNSDVVTKGTSDSPGRELLSVEVTLTDASPGDPILVWFDGQMTYRGGIAQWVCWHEKVWIMAASATFKNDYFGASTPRSTSDDDYLTTSDPSRSMTRLFSRVQERPMNDLGSNISGEANNSNAVLSIPVTGSTVIQAPSDIDTVPRKIVFAFVIDREQVSYQTGSNTGFKNANSTTDDWQIEDLDVFAINLKEKH